MLYIYIYVCVYNFIYIYICIYIHAFKQADTCVYICTRIYVRVTYKNTCLGKVKDIIEDYGIL